MIPSENVTIMVHSLACLVTPGIRTATVLAFHIVRLWAICLWVYVLVSVLGIRLRLFGSWCNDRAVENKWPIGFWCGTAWHADHKRTREPDVFSRNKKTQQIDDVNWFVFIKVWSPNSLQFGLRVLHHGYLPDCGFFLSNQCSQMVFVSRGMRSIMHVLKDCASKRNLAHLYVLGIQAWGHTAPSLVDYVIKFSAWGGSKVY